MWLRMMFSRRGVVDEGRGEARPERPLHDVAEVEVVAVRLPRVRDLHVRLAGPDPARVARLPAAFAVEAGSVAQDGDPVALLGGIHDGPLADQAT